jgi:hypothetical protein
MQPEDIDPSQILTSALADEIQVQAYLRDIRAGKPLQLPVLVRTKAGRFIPLGNDSVCKVESCRRSGVLIKGYVLADVLEDIQADKIEGLRQALNEAHKAQN